MIKTLVLEGQSTSLATASWDPATHAVMEKLVSAVNNKTTDYVNVKTHGAKGDGATDDTASFTAAMAAVPFGGALYVPHGTYLVTSGFAGNIKRVLGEGNGPYNGFLQCTAIKVADSVSVGGIDSVFSTSSGHGIALENLVIDCNGRANYGVKCTQASSFNSHLVCVLVTGAVLDGFYFDRCQTSRFYNLYASNCGRHGLYILDSNNTCLYGVSALNNADYQIKIEAVASSGGCCVFGLDAENYTQAGSPGAVQVKGTRTPTVIYGGWVETTYGHGVVLDNARFTTIEGLRIGGVAQGGSGERAVKITGGASGNWVRGCAVGYGEGGGNFGRILVDAGCEFNYVSENSYLEQSVTLPHAPTVTITDRTSALTSVDSEGSAAPTAGAWRRGDRVWNNAPSALTTPGWICVSAGSPGTWKAMASLGA